MKRNILFFLYLIFGFTDAQLHSPSEIDSQIEKAKLLSVSEPNKAIELSQTIYSISKNTGYKKGMLESATILMAKYFEAGNFKKVIDLSKDAEQLAAEANDNIALSNTYRLRAASYTELGFNDQSFKEFQEALKIAEKIPSKNSRNYQKALIYTGLASYFAHINAPIDSVIQYQKKCLGAAIVMDDSKEFLNKKYYTLALSYINLGKTSVATHHIKDAETYFSKALEISRNKKYLINKDLEITTLNEFAWLYHDQKHYEKATYYAEQAENLEKSVRLPYIRRDIYEVYFKSFVELGDKEQSKKYMNLYTKLNDSLVNAEKKTINTPVENMMEKQGELHSNTIKEILITTSAIIIALLLGGWFLWKRNQNKLHKRYEIIIDHLKNETQTVQPQPVLVKTEDKINESNITISQDTTTSLLHKLSRFEKSEKFLKKDMSLTALSNSLNTNPRYLSEIIKQHKDKNFNNYLNGLRIQYIINKLYDTPIFREYKISYLAEACGFSSREVFAVIFKKETGVTPSYFISQLKKDDKKQEIV
ncbi:tetratricopeptide repeat protein [Chryseobacterium soli]|uniref:tetratricopeptide repeat protein n=1 Tax=Chryseobacterium soli TaxID=445961 RepID=UPI002955327C|nr:tetratricopeptide repeat protein [Chryseobacterium soli]MDV7699303.1 tetratricopeptide repeat protein [Chryseobacterium soli]